MDVKCEFFVLKSLNVDLDVTQLFVYVQGLKKLLHLLFHNFLRPL